MTDFCLIKSVWSKFLKIGSVLIYQTYFMKNSQSKFKSYVWRKNDENNNANEWIHNLKLFPVFHLFLRMSFLIKNYFWLDFRCFYVIWSRSCKIDFKIQKNMLEISNEFDICIRFFRLKIYIRLRSYLIFYPKKL